MNRFYAFCSAFLVAFGPSLMHAESPPSEKAPIHESIHWYTSLKEAQEKAKEEKLPLYVCFSGPSWCFWCQKLEKEIHASPDFIAKMQKKFIFVFFDIPKEQSEADPAIRDLMEKYEVYGVPVILIFSNNMEKLGQLSYQKISAQEFADLALSIGHPLSG